MSRARNWDHDDAGALAIASAIKSRRITALEVVTGALDRIGRFDGILNCFTSVMAERALADARKVDEAVARGEDPGPLAGVPFAVKNLLDIGGGFPAPYAHTELPHYQWYFDTINEALQIGDRIVVLRRPAKIALDMKLKSGMNLQEQDDIRRQIHSILSE